MTRRPLDKNGAAAKVGSKDGFYTAAIVRVTPEGKSELEDAHPQAKFLLNPSSWSDNKSVNWVSQSVPGQSHDVKQWISGGPRVVTFDALVTRDINERQDVNPLDKLINSAINAVSSVASDFFDVNVPPLTDLLNGLAGGIDNHPLNIAPWLDYYRSLTLPTYSENNELTSSPPLVALHVGASLHNGNTEFKGELTPTGEVWIVKNLGINITKQLPNLTPMEAIVSFQLEQYITNSVSANRYSPIDTGGNSANALTRPASIIGSI